MLKHGVREPPRRNQGTIYLHREITMELSFELYVIFSRVAIVEMGTAKANAGSVDGNDICAS